MDNSKSLVVAKKGIFQKIQEFFRKLFQIKNKTIIEIDTNEEENNNQKQEKFINDLKKSANSDIKELIAQIQNDDIDLDLKTDEELNEIESKLENYLKYLDQEISCKKEEIVVLEKAISAVPVN